MSDQPLPVMRDEVEHAELLIAVCKGGALLMWQGVGTFVLAAALSRFDAMHDHRMGPFYLTAAWSCWWIIVLAGWIFLGLAYGRTLKGLLMLDRPIYAGIFLFAGGLVFGMLTLLLVGVAWTHVDAVWL